MKKIFCPKLNSIQWLGILCLLIGIVLLLLGERIESKNWGSTQYPGFFENIMITYSPNMSIDLIFIAFTIFIINHLNQKESEKREKRDLIFRMGSANNIVATEAARRLKNGDFWITSLRGERFDGANLCKADFVGVDLRNTDLMGTNFTEARMENAHLDGALILDTVFHKTDLQKANFNGAIIRSTKKDLYIFNNANLSFANFEGAEFSVIKNEKMMEDESVELQFANRLNHAIMPNGKRYDGRYQLPGDVNQPGVDINDDPSMANFYGVSLEDYGTGKKWFIENLSNKRYQIFL